MTASSALASPVAVLRALAQLDATLTPNLPPGVPHSSAAEARLAGGVPALTDEPLLDAAEWSRALRAVAEILIADPSVAQAAATALRLADEADLAAAALAGDWESIQSRAARAGLDADAAVALADFAVRPWLRLAADAVRALLSTANWRDGHCPACGAPPLLAELRGAERERVLRCGRCASAWTFARLTCPACGEQRHAQLGYLHAEGQGEFRRSDTCDSCHTYVKAIAVLDPLGPSELLLADLESSALDFAALERGFRRFV